MGDKIVEKAQELYMKYGIRSVSMDDIAREFGMSKKTLYQYVDGKTDLIDKTIRSHVTMESHQIEAIQTQNLDAIEEMFAIHNHVSKLLQNLNPAVVYDLKKYYPEQYNLLKQINDDFIYKTILNNLNSGIEQGIYRTNINTDVIAKFYVTRADMILDLAIFPIKDYERKDLYDEFILYHLYAVVSDKGKEELLSILNKN